MSWPSGELRFDGRVALVTGAGVGLGRMYALALAKRGAKVVVNDLGVSTTGEGKNSNAADAVVAEIKAAGGEAIANYKSVEEGADLVKTAMDAFGRLDIIINNAGILRDRSFKKMSDNDWDLINSIHVKAVFSIIKAAWPIMLQQKYGRIVNVSSTSGLFGNFGQTNYSAAKMAVVGMASTLKQEGAKNNIKINTLAPGAGSRMTATFMPKELVDAWKPDYVVPMALLLSHEAVPCSGQIFQAGGGWFSQVSWQRSEGLMLPIDGQVTPENLAKGWEQVTKLPAPQSVPKQFGGTHEDRQLEQIMKL